MMTKMKNDKDETTFDEKEIFGEKNIYFCQIIYSVFNQYYSNNF